MSGQLLRQTCHALRKPMILRRCGKFAVRLCLPEWVIQSHITIKNHKSLTSHYYHPQLYIYQQLHEEKNIHAEKKGNRSTFDGAVTIIAMKTPHQTPSRNQC
jgi:hypothetical protein